MPDFGPAAGFQPGPMTHSAPFDPSHGGTTRPLQGTFWDEHGPIWQTIADETNHIGSRPATPPSARPAPVQPPADSSTNDKNALLAQAREEMNQGLAELFGAHTDSGLALQIEALWEKKIAGTAKPWELEQLDGLIEHALALKGGQPTTTAPPGGGKPQTAPPADNTTDTPAAATHPGGDNGPSTGHAPTHATEDIVLPPDVHLPADVEREVKSRIAQSLRLLRAAGANEQDMAAMRDLLPKIATQTATQQEFEQAQEIDLRVGRDAAARRGANTDLQHAADDSPHAVPPYGVAHQASDDELWDAASGSPHAAFASNAPPSYVAAVQQAIADAQKRAGVASTDATHQEEGPASQSARRADAADASAANSERGVQTEGEDHTADAPQPAAVGAGAAEDPILQAAAPTHLGIAPGNGFVPTPPLPPGALNGAPSPTAGARWAFNPGATSHAAAHATPPTPGPAGPWNWNGAPSSIYGPHRPSIWQKFKSFFNRGQSGPPNYAGWNPRMTMAGFPGRCFNPNPCAPYQGMQAMLAAQMLTTTMSSMMFLPSMYFWNPMGFTGGCGMFPGMGW